MIPVARGVLLSIAAMAASPPLCVRSTTGKDLAELLERWGARGTVGSLIHPTRQPDQGVGVGERVDPVDQDRWRAAEAGPFRLPGCVNDVAGDVQLGILTLECPQVRVSLAPVRAVVEIQQGHVHDQTVNLLPQEKVKQ